MQKQLKHLCIVVLMLFAAVVITGPVVYAEKNTEDATEEEKKDDSKKQPFTITGTKIKLKVKNGTDITDALDDALEAARDKATDKKPYTVIVPKGNYYISKTTHIWSNTILDLTAGVKLTSKGASHSLLISGTNGKYKGKKDFNASAACKGYNGFKNITVKGGTFVSTSKNTSTIIRFAHAKNITLEGVTVTGGACAHQIEVAAINGFYVRNCTFKNLKLKKNTTDKQEALQLDIACASEVFRNVYLDGTVMKNVEVTGCTFSDVPRGVGSHTMLVGAYFDNIKINNNTFKNCSEEAIIGVNYRNCEIKDNKIENCGGGILFDYFKATYETSVFTTIFDGKTKYKGKFDPNAATVISGNQITTKYYANCDEVCGIKVYGFNLEKKAKGQDKKYISAKNYYVSGVTITDNTIQTAGYGIHVMDTRNSTISNNTVTQKGVSAKDKQKSSYSGIFVEKESQGIQVSDNKVSGSKTSGVMVQISSKVKSIKANVITNCASKGINVYDKSSVDEVTLNQITNCADSAIIAGSGSTIGSVTENTISSNGSTQAAVAVYDKSVITLVSTNTIKNTSADKVGYSNSAFKITDFSTIGSIENNTLISEGGAAVSACAVLMDKGTVTGSITGNDMVSTSSHAFKITNQSSVGGDIGENTFTQVGGSAILMDNATIGGSIKDNKLGTSTDHAIKITKGAKVGKDVSGNTVDGSGGCGILLDTGAVIGGSISGNTLDKIAQKGIKITGKSKIGADISNNTVTATEEGLLGYQSTITGKVTGNKFTSLTARSIKISECTVGACNAEDNECNAEVYYK